MKSQNKIAFAIFGILIFFISGGVACTYAGGAGNPILVVILGILVFLTVGAAACSVGSSRIEKRKNGPQ